MDEKVEVLNINLPGTSSRVDAAKYAAMKKAMLAVLPDDPPGPTAKEAIAATKAHLPDDLFPGGATAGWWFKCVQLDLEARGVIARSTTSPLRFRKTGA